MDKSAEILWEIKLGKIAEKLKLNQMDAYIVQSKEELPELLDRLMKNGASVNAGGSMTLAETGILDYLNAGDYVFYDKTSPEVKTNEQIAAVNRQAFSADYYFTSSNAITEDGWLYNVDGRGNRVAAMMYGPENVIVVVGRNKCVKTFDDAIQRNREISGPANCIRLGKKTPCSVTGQCTDCSSPDRICNEFTLIKRSNPKGRIKVILLNFEAGY